MGEFFPLKNPTILLLGPTGAGKTPLGEAIESQGLWQRRWIHFDFGANLRRIAGEDTTHDRLSREDVDILRDCLAHNRLLEDDQFPIAARVLRSFLLERGVTPEVGVVLNGLPRHVGQAERLAEILNVSAVVELVCDAETVRRRIQSDVGGDRAQRVDDDASAVDRKLDIYRRRTAPLTEYYRNRSTPILSLKITPTSTGASVLENLQKEAI